MLRFAVLAIALSTSLPATSFAQPRPAYYLQTAPARKVEATYTCEIRYANLVATEWEVVVAKPRDLPSQAIAKVTVEPAGADMEDATALKQPLVRLILRPATEAQKKAVKVVVRTEATLMSRRLVPLPPDVNAPKVTPASEGERRAALAVTAHLNHDDATFQKWLDTNKLRRQNKESDVAFARRVFDAMKKTLTPQQRINHDRKASSTCKAGGGDCGSLSGVFVSALRANKIPARQLTGRFVKSDRPFDEKSNHGVHVRPEFFAEQVGWVPVDPALGFHFGDDAGDLLTLHLDGDLVVESKIVGKKTLDLLQTVACWVRGEGDFANAQWKEDWRVRELRPARKTK